MTFWDANLSFGPVRAPVPGAPYELEQLIPPLDQYGIEKALVYHSLAREYDPAAGNRALMRSIAGSDRFLPVFALLPHHTGEMPAPDALLRELQRQQVRAATLFPAPGHQHFSLRRWSCGPLLDALAACHLPLIIGLDQLGGSLEALGDFALQYPRLPIIATGVNFRADRMLYPLMEHAPQLYIETSAYKPFRGITEFCRRFGSERLLFGSGMPVTDPAASVSLITYAEISPAEKENIARKNLQRLLEHISL